MVFTTLASLCCPSARGLDLFLPPWPLGWLVTHSKDVVRWDPEHKERERPGVWWQPVQTIGRPTPPRETCRTPAGAPRSAGLQGAEPREVRPAEKSAAPRGLWETINRRYCKPRRVWTLCTLTADQ